MLEPLDTAFRPVLSDKALQEAIYSATGRLMEKRRQVVAPEVLPDFQQLRDQAQAIKRHTLDNLDHYLEQFETQLGRHGGKVVWCRDAREVAEFVVKLARQKDARLLVKSKSMLSEEIELNAHLEKEGFEVVETDLGEFIVQLQRSRPYHIVAPALNLTRYDVADLFSRKLGVDQDPVPEHETQTARATLRQKFLSADIGITGANFLVADSGAVVLATNEGNGRMCTTLPRVHVAIAGIEKLIPRAQDLAVFLKLLGRSATGQPLTVYTSFLAGPRRRGENDGPEELYVVLVDNGRTRLLADRDKREMLSCLRCGACLNHCPVYRKIGGHSYPWVYSGPIGAILSPQFLGVQQAPWLPFASSLCGACAEVCPVKIDIPKHLLDLRSEVNKWKKREGKDRLEALGFRMWAWLMRHPKIYEALGTMGSMLFPEQEPGKWIRTLPPPFNVGPARAWLSERDIPPFPSRSFRQIWRERKSRGGKS